MSYEQAIPRAEFPNPQFERKYWQNLNGKWKFKFDHGNSGVEQDYVNKDVFDMEINVPFTYESSLSGINIKDFCDCVWYKRTFIVNEKWDVKTGKILLHFGAVDYHAKVWVNGQYAGFHRGGMTHFMFDVTKFITDGENTVVLRAYDNQRGGKQPIGKQSNGYYSSGCCYTRTTGIWQTVWLEYIPFQSYIKSFKIYTDVSNAAVTINVSLDEYIKNSVFTAEIFYNGTSIETKSLAVGSNNISLQFQIPKDNLHLWDIGKGNLYDLIMTYGEDSTKVRDTVYSYFGMRSICIENEKVLLNGRSVFQRLVLDQGFYPDGTFTAPTGDALEKDIVFSMAAGFNGARLHQKIFEPLFHYYADKYGYITWGEHGNWGMDYSGESYQNFMCEWIEALERDFNHPSIVGWCPHNETPMGQRHDDLAYIYRVTKAFDYTRPVIDTSGYVHVQTDIFDVHDYDQNVEIFTERYDAMLKTGGDKKIFQNHNIIKDKDIEHMPYFVSEFGGTWWSDRTNSSPDRNQSWGYGKSPEDIEAFYARFEGLVNALLDNPRIFAFCYTQLTDVEQEQNGVFYYDREKKFDLERLNKILTCKAAIED